MPNLNKVQLMGNLTRDPEVRYTPKGTAVCDLSIAVNSGFGTGDDRREETTFIDITLWGKAAENAGQYLRKGRPVYIEGRLQMDSWDDKQTGQKRSRLKVVGESWQFLGSKPDSDKQEPQQRVRRTADRPDQQPGYETREQHRDAGFAAEGLGADTDDDIPF